MNPVKSRKQYYPSRQTGAPRVCTWSPKTFTPLVGRRPEPPWRRNTPPTYGLPKACPWPSGNGIAQNFEIADYQKKKSINIKNVRSLTKEILRILGKPKAFVSVIFCDTKFIKKLNQRFFNKSYATDVISFSLKDDLSPNYLGEIIISVEQAKKMCDLYGNTWQKELALYLVHGILHLIGYNDIKKKERIRMERKQEEILSKLFKKHKRIIDNIGVFNK